MNKKILILAAILLIAITVVLTTQQIPPKAPDKINNTLSSEWTNSKNDLSKVKVAVLYENIIDKQPLGPQRSIDEIIQLLKQTHADMIFRGFWRWLPPPDSPNNIHPELTAYLAERVKISPAQIPELADKMGYNYKELDGRIAAIKKEIPGILFVGAIPAQRINRIDKNDITGKVYTADETWAMALDPQKWNMAQNGKSYTKEDFQKQFALWHGWIKSGAEYGRTKVEAYFPDITNPQFQELILSWAKKQIDSGADAIWIDGLPFTPYLHQITGDINHPAVKDSYESMKKIIDEIHKYGESKGKRIYVGSWGIPLKFVEGLPYIPDNIDFVTISPMESEISNKKFDETYTKISQTRKIYPDTPIFAFIDWGVDISPTVAFSQKLSKKEQENMLQMLDGFFAKNGINFVYPLHGGYMGAGKVTTKLSFGKYRSYDSSAPEFGTYGVIKELANKKEVK